VVWTLRVVVWLVLLLIGYRGVTAIVAGPAATTPAAAPSASTSAGFPTTLAQAYALQFGNVYLNFSPGTAARRATMLVPFLGSAANSQLGWNGAGTERLQSEDVASVQVQSSTSATVTLLADVNDNMIELAVPIYASGGAMAVSGEPALLAAPTHAAPPAATTVNSDPSTDAALLSQLPAFFRAYASGGQADLSRFLAPGANVTGLGGAVTLGSVQSVTAPYGGSTRVITVVVDWNVGSAASSPTVAAAPASLEMTYRMTVVRQNSNWYVQTIGASPQSPGPP
jgi:hypothetical protein